MNTIKFSSDYKKLPNNWQTENIARLIFVEAVNIRNQTKAFLDYDTEFGDGGFYWLADGEYLVLLFRHQSGAFFSTIRRRTSDKEAYYRHKVGEVFEMVLTEEKKDENLHPK